MNKANPTLIGGFVVGGIVLLVVCVLLFTQLKVSDAMRFVVYFTESVNGLNVGAPVKVKGVAVGNVVDIRVLADMDGSRVLTPVVIEVDPNKMVDRSGHVSKKRNRSIQPLIERGLRAQLQVQSLVTGQLYVALDFLPYTPVDLVGSTLDFHPYEEIPAIPSSKEKITNTIDEVVSEFRQLPLHEIAAALVASIRRAEALLNSPKIESILTSTDQALQQVNATLKESRARLGPMLANLDGAIGDHRRLTNDLDREVQPTLKRLDETLLAATSAMRRIDGAAGSVNDPVLQHTLDAAIDEVSQAARAIRVLSDFIQRNPNALIVGKENDGD
ncbi:MlaD family protein [Methylococcus sp. ANG]|uniref:MlaD family protein n=1 Tax=unclassified Methylococcus TaxID=2618889 RepID=UPI001C52854E|nr:MlaD family protein [Methylococcus sp. Mc7]QXP84762.1 MCE family protein [Methylococcus sp. Mc7]